MGSVLAYRRLALWQLFFADPRFVREGGREGGREERRERWEEGSDGRE